MKYRNKLNRNAVFSLLLAGLIVLSCNEKNKSTTTLFELMDNTGIDFSNNLKHSKDFNVLTFRNFYNGGGVAIGDINNDSLSDIFFTANMGGNKLYLNKGNWKFEDISEKAGFAKDKKQWSTGVVMADINHDGWLDIFVANSGNLTDSTLRRNQLFINNHQLGFSDSAHAYGLNDDGYTTHASFFDYDLDGDLDCFLVNNSPIPVNTLNYANKRALPAKDWPVKNFLKGGGDHLFRNDNGQFVEVTQEAGIHGSLISLGLGVTVGDVNNDGYPDIYVSNDFFERDYLYINKQDGHFADELEQWMQHTSLASMGADIGDINNDGYPDIFTTDMLPDDDYRLKTTSSFDNIDVFKLKERSGFYRQYMQNTLQLNNRNGQFNDIAWYSGVAASDWSWGALLFDADNDGLNDILVCNGIYLDVTDQDFIDFFANDIIQKMVLTGRKEDVDDILNKMPSRAIPNKIFKNLDGLSFSDAGKSWGLTQTSFSNGAAYGDLDNDGDLDLVINNVNSPAFVYRNNNSNDELNHYIGVSLRGKGKNSFAIGSKVKIYANNREISRELVPSRGFQSSVEYKMIIGLGPYVPVDSMVIVWPDRTYTKIDKPAINKVHELSQPAGNNVYPAYTAGEKNAAIFVPAQGSFDKHEEDNHIDFYYERNIPVMLSREGPKAACADVNADGLEDIYIGGAAGQAGQLYIQTDNGFVKKLQPEFLSYADFEDVAVLFFDADGDKDADLFIGAGGNHVTTGKRQLQHRLYLNDGKGNFSIDTKAFPQNDMNISVAVENDFDKDGDLDLFVGGRSVPFQYGADCRSYLYMNDGRGHFSDVTEKWAPGLLQPGMVTGAVWANVTGDSTRELVVVGEWMSPQIFSLKGNSFEKVETALNKLKGWWQAVAATDADGDGNTDLVLGNIGNNFYLRCSDLKPVKIWINDFDGNGVVDKIITRTVDGKDMPVFLKREMADQLPSIKSQNLKHVDYAKKPIDELFSATILDKATVKEINYTSSCVAINDGKGNFSPKEFAPPAQFSCINVLRCEDIDMDGRPEILSGGNNFGFQPQFGRMDACAVNVLRNHGSGFYGPVNSRMSGLDIKGQVRDIAIIKGKDKLYALFLQNNDYPVLYTFKNGKVIQ